MILHLIPSIFWILCFAIVSYALPVIDENDAATYLKKFGYLEDSAGQGTSALKAKEVVSAAIKDFQRFAGLNETGEMDNETITKMNMPRCGRKDKIIGSDEQNRYVIRGSKWSTNEITYRITKYSSRFRDSRRGRNEIIRAFKIWSDVTPLNFRERRWWGPVDIKIRFESGDHGDGNAFDGPGGTLAHAFYPEDGDAHFDDQEMWTINDANGINLFQVAAHEFGHSLGLDHSEYEEALMTPFYKEYVPGFQLHFDDIEGIQELYGPKYQPTPPDYDFGYMGPPPDTFDYAVTEPPPDTINFEDMAPPPDTSDAPDLCHDSKIDAVTRTKSGTTYVFKDIRVHLQNCRKRAVEEGNAKLYDIPTKDIVYRKRFERKKTEFFYIYHREENPHGVVPASADGHFYWEVLSSGIAEGYPRKIYDDWNGLPGNLDASVTWSNGRTYFFKGRHYWRFTNKRMNSGFPKLISVGFQGIPDNLDAAFIWSGNGKKYFFKGNQYWQYDSSRDPPVSMTYPQQARKWSSLLADGIDAAFQWKNNRTYFFKGNQYYRYNDIASEVDEVDPLYHRSTPKEWFGCQ